MIIDYITGKAIVIAFAIICALSDIRDRKIDIRIFAGMFIAESVAIVLMMALGEKVSLYNLLGTAVGLLLVATSYITRGAIGLGDGVYFALTGLAMGIKNNIVLVLSSIFISAIASLIVITINMNDRIAIKKFKHPLLAYAAPVTILLCFCSIAQR